MSTGESGFGETQAGVFPESTLVPSALAPGLDECEAFLGYIDATIMLPIQRCLLEGIACIEDCNDTVSYNLRDAIMQAEARRQRLDVKCQDAVSVKLAQLYAQVIPMGYQPPSYEELHLQDTMEIPNYEQTPIVQPSQVVTPEGVPQPPQVEIPSAFLPAPQVPIVEQSRPQRPPPEPVAQRPPGPAETTMRPPPLSRERIPQQGPAPRPIRPTPPRERPPIGVAPGPPAPVGPVLPIARPEPTPPSASLGPVQQPDLGPMGNLMFNPDRPDEDSRIIQWFGTKMLEIINSMSVDEMMEKRNERATNTAVPSGTVDISPEEY